MSGAVDPIKLYAMRFENLYMFSAELKESQNPFYALSSDTRKAIVVLLATKGPLTLSQIASELNLTPPSVLRNLRILMETGLVGIVPETATRRFKQYYTSVPYFTSRELNRVLQDLEPIIAGVVERYREGLDRAYTRFLDIAKNENLAVSRVLSYIDEKKVRLGFFQFFQSTIMRELVKMKAIPLVTELEIPWAGYIVIKD
ncbi:MAG: hypothetical protein DRO13_05090 [Thermoprotei archaeon]|nr:MAG: hypothetical protein DRO13_05090 [Thermoprotei archaeon]